MKGYVYPELALWVENKVTNIASCWKALLGKKAMVFRVGIKKKILAREKIR